MIEDLTFTWEIIEGEGTLQGVTDQEVEFRAPAVPGPCSLEGHRDPARCHRDG